MIFLDATALRELTGYARKSRQVAQLRAMGVPFYINGAGRPIVAVSAVEGVKSKQPKAPVLWAPAALKRA